MTQLPGGRTTHRPPHLGETWHTPRALFPQAIHIPIMHHHSFAVAIELRQQREKEQTSTPRHTTTTAATRPSLPPGSTSHPSIYLDGGWSRLLQLGTVQSAFAMAPSGRLVRASRCSHGTSNEMGMGGKWVGGVGQQHWRAVARRGTRGRDCC